jgi:hypothetical protein
MIDDDLAASTSSAGTAATTAVQPLARGAQNWHRLPSGRGVPAIFVGARGSGVRERGGRELLDLYCGSGVILLAHPTRSRSRPCAL